MHTAYWHKPDFSVVMCLSRQVDCLSIAPEQKKKNDCALAVSATIRVILTKISNRSGIAVQWNGGGGGGEGKQFEFSVTDKEILWA